MAVGGLLPDVPAVQLGLVVVATGLVWVGSGWLESSAEHLSVRYGLPPLIQGSVVVAVGSSVPELASVVFAGLAGVFEMGVGAIIGSAIFNVLVIPAAAGIASRQPVASSRGLVYKEAQFYMLAVAVLVLTFALAVIYYPVGGGPNLRGVLTRPLAAIPLGLYGLYLFIQWQDVTDYRPDIDPGTRDVRREWATLLVGLLVILVAVEELVYAIDGLARTFGIPAFLAGVTVLAAATSLPDTLVSVRAARAGKGVISLGNVFGSNTFDLLVAVPVGVMLVGAVTVDFTVAVPMFAVLTLATILLYALLRTDLSLTDPEAYLLLIAYIAFVVWVAVETAGVTDLIHGM